MNKFKNYIGMFAFALIALLAVTPSVTFADSPEAPNGPDGNTPPVPQTPPHQPTGPNDTTPLEDGSTVAMYSHMSHATQQWEYNHGFQSIGLILCIINGWDEVTTGGGSGPQIER